ncbi:hypothetical protein AB0K12_12065 [Nonomuraea sp. NPDC049419]
MAVVRPLLIGTDTAHQLGPIAPANLRGQFTSTTASSSPAPSS